MTDNHIDVLINGCGIGGAMLAYLLGRQGHRVVVVEQARRERAINGADLLKPAGIRVVEAAGLLAEVTRRGGRVRHELEVYHDGELLRYFNYSSVDARGYFILMPCESLRRLVLEKSTAKRPSRCCSRPASKRCSATSATRSTRCA